MNAAVIVFPGTNCEIDTKNALEFLGWDVEYVWHDDRIEKKYDAIFLPGGFSYGDYVGAGRLAKFSNAVKSLPVGDTMIVGICNGFQVLIEAGLVEGTLTSNMNGRFLCENSPLHFFNKRIRLPIAHQYGNYTISNYDTIKDKIFLKYADNKNGSDMNIAGLYDKEYKIIAMMPHPERAVFAETGNTDGRLVFEFIKNEI